MKAANILLGAGGTLVFVGLVITLAAVLPGSQTDSFTIPANTVQGVLNYYVYEFDLFGSGSLSVDYTVTVGTVDVYVLDAPAYDEYIKDVTWYPIHGEYGEASGSFVAGLPASGKYFLVFEHASGSEGLDQPVRATLRITGVTPVLFAGGLGLLAGGAVILALGIRWRRKAKPAVLPPAYGEPPMSPPPPLPPVMPPPP